MRLRFYIAGKYADRERIAKFAEEVRAKGHEVSSSWLQETYAPNVQMAELGTPTMREMAIKDCKEIQGSTAFVLFTEKDTTPTCRNGRLVELGFALGSGYREMHLIGPAENIFCHLPCIRHHNSPEEFLAALPECSPVGIT